MFDALAQRQPIRHQFRRTECRRRDALRMQSRPDPYLANMHTSHLIFRKPRGRNLTDSATRHLARASRPPYSGRVDRHPRRCGGDRPNVGFGLREMVAPGKRGNRRNNRQSLTVASFRVVAKHAKYLARAHSSEGVTRARRAISRHNGDWRDY